MITGDFAQHTELISHTEVIQRAKWYAKFATTTPWRFFGTRSDAADGMQFEISERPSSRRTKDLILVFVLGVLTGIAFFVVHALVSARASRPAIVMETNPSRSPRVETTIPMFYINLPANRDRAAYMEHVYSGAGNSLTRIPAVNGKDRDMLRRRLAMNHTALVEYDNSSAQHLHSVTLKHFQAVPGEIATILSHLDAIYTAHQNPAIDAALVMEDDAADFLSPFWPGKLEDLVYLANEVDPEWAAIRLEWAGKQTAQHIWPQWVDQLAQWSAKVGGEAALTKLHNTWRRTGRLPMDSKPPLIMPYAAGWGAVATLYSRRGMDALIKKYFAGFDFDNLQEDKGGTANEDGGQPRWSCPKTLPCISDLSFWGTLAPHVFIATPPWFTVRTAEVETGVRDGRSGSNHVIMHLQVVLRALQWAISLDDALKPGGGRNVPWDTEWKVSKLESTDSARKKLQRVTWAQK